MSPTRIDDIFACIDRHSKLVDVDALPPKIRTSLLAYFDEGPSLSSFSAANWTRFFKDHGEEFGFYSEVFEMSNLHMAKDITPAYQLPQSFHTRVLEHASLWMDVYRFQRTDRTTEEATLRLLEPFLVPIIALFQGRVIDEPEHHMIETKYSTGGKVEHKMFLVGGVLFFVIEMKLFIDEKAFQNYITQLFLELLSAAAQNGRCDFKNLKIYGLLSDFSRFHFYTYDPHTKRFYQNEKMVVSDAARPEMCKDIVKVCNKIFGIVLTAYIDGLETIAKSIRSRAKRGEYTAKSSSPFGPQNDSDKDQKDDGSRKSTGPWDRAHRLAVRCRCKFEEDVKDIEGIERRGEEALELLTKSSSTMPPNYFSPNEELHTREDMGKIAADAVREVYQAELLKRGIKRKWGSE